MTGLSFNHRLLVTMLVALAPILSACSGSIYISTPASAKKYAIIYIQGVPKDTFVTSLTCGAQAEAKKLGNVYFTPTGDQTNSLETQTQVIETTIARRPDAIIVAPTEGQTVITALTQAQRAGIRLVFVDTKTGDGRLASSSIATDNRAGGRLAADKLAEAVNYTGAVIAEGSTPGIAPTDQRLKGFEDEIKKYSNINYLGVQYSHSTTNEAATEVSATLVDHPEITGIFAVSTQEVEGAALALTDAGRQGVVNLIGFDTSDLSINDLKSSVIQGLIVEEPLEMGKEAIDQAVNALRGKAITHVITTPFTFLTRDNIYDPDVYKYIYKTAC